MADWWDWTGDPGPWQSNEAPAINWNTSTSNAPGSTANQQATDAAPGTNWLSSILSAVAPLAQRFAAPAASAVGSLVNANRATQASATAGQQESAALNRGIDLQTAQWLQQQQNLAPYQQTGRIGLEGLTRMIGREQPGLPGATPAVQGSQYGMPRTTAVQGSQYGLPSPYPGWQPRQFQRPDDVNAGAYQWNPQQGPQAADYRYQPGQTPDAAQYASGPPQLYAGAMPGTQVPTLSGQELLAQDPGAAFRQTEARKALEASAFAKGSGLSGGTLQALQSRSQDLASQEYGNAWGRMMEKNREQYGRDWGQYQQAWNQGVTGTELGLRTQQQNFAQAEAASRLREQVNQVASQQGWSQAQAEAAFREQMAQQSQAQNWGQALQGQQNAYTQGLGAEQWAQKQQQDYWTQLYDRQSQQAQEAYTRDRYGNEQDYNRQQQQAQQMYERDRYGNEQDYTRQQNLYRQQLGQFLLPWEQASTLANLGGQATGLYGTQGQNASNSIATLLGRLGETQAQSTLGQALPQNTATNTITNSVGSLLSRLNS